MWHMLRPVKGVVVDQRWVLKREPAVKHFTGQNGGFLSCLYPACLFTSLCVCGFALRGLDVYEPGLLPPACFCELPSAL